MHHKSLRSFILKLSVANRSTVCGDACGGLMQGGQKEPTKITISLPSSAGQLRKKHNKSLMDEDKEDHSQILYLHLLQPCSARNGDWGQLTK